MERAPTDAPPTPVVHPDNPGQTPGLRLRQLTLVGFKSFADKTVFSFDDLITGIVGPNGCGKSNIVDAVKWVLGERSSKNLRGKEMIDVIFAGSVGRKPSGMAAVTLTFENPRLADLPLERVTGEDEGSASELDEPAGGGEAEQEVCLSGDDDAGDEGVSEAQAIIAERRHIGRALPVDADEVAVERSLFRDGKSQYLINGRLARLSDIRDPFLDTCVVADAY